MSNDKADALKCHGGNHIEQNNWCFVPPGIAWDLHTHDVKQQFSMRHKRCKTSKKHSSALDASHRRQPNPFPQRMMTSWQICKLPSLCHGCCGQPGMATPHARLEPSVSLLVHGFLSLLDHAQTFHYTRHFFHSQAPRLHSNSKHARQAFPSNAQTTLQPINQNPKENIDTFTEASMTAVTAVGHNSLFCPMK